jgi:hypothetical protein
VIADDVQGKQKRKRKDKKTGVYYLHRGSLHKLVSATPGSDTGGGFLWCCKGWYGFLSDSGCEE